MLIVDNDDDDGERTPENDKPMRALFVHNAHHWENSPSQSMMINSNDSVQVNTHTDYHSMIIDCNKKSQSSCQGYVAAKQDLWELAYGNSQPTIFCNAILLHSMVLNQPAN